MHCCFDFARHGPLSTRLLLSFSARFPSARVLLRPRSPSTLSLKTGAKRKPSRRERERERERRRKGKFDHSRAFSLRLFLPSAPRPSFARAASSPSGETKEERLQLSPKMEVEPPPPPQVSKLDAMDTADNASAATTTHHAAAASAAESEGDLYTRLKTLQRQLEFYEIQVRRGGCRRRGKREKERESKERGAGHRGSMRARRALSTSTSTPPPKKKLSTPGGVHPRGAALPQARAPPRPGGGQAHPVCSFGHRPILGNDRLGLGHCGIDDGVELPCPRAVDDQPRAASPLGVGGAAQALKRARGRCVFFSL